MGSFVSSSSMNGAMILASESVYDDDGSTYYVVSEKKVYEMCKILRISYLKQEPVVKIIACLNLPVRERSTK